MGGHTLRDVPFISTSYFFIPLREGVNVHSIQTKRRLHLIHSHTSDNGWMGT
ncbi:MAG: hypothetical protein ACRC6V_02920 [Bacteroidales bacterium]